MYGEGCSNSAVVFPSRRAGIYFRKYLSLLIEKPLWSPSIFSIEEFIQTNSKYILADKLLLIFELYKVFKTHGESESFDMFYPWGEMLLRDFDEIDKNLVPVNDLFRVMKEFKDVEEEFVLPFEELEQFKAFWKTFTNRELSNVEKEFVRIWNMLGRVYADFKKKLSKQNLAYDGMIIRTMVEQNRSKNTLIEQWDKIFFAGFNSLSKCEEKIIGSLVKEGKAEIFWDADEYFVNNYEQESGKFLRKNLKSMRTKSPMWVENNLSKPDGKFVNIIGAPLNIGQVKALAIQLKELSDSNSNDPNKAAVILPDESLLLPVLYSIPADIKKINVTMGFPFKNSPLFNFIELLKNLQLGKKQSGKNCVFYHKNVTEILMHPYVKFISAKLVFDIVNYIKKYSIVYITGKKLVEFENEPQELLSLIFTPASTIEELFTYLFKILDKISAKSEYSEESYARFELEYFYSVYEQLNRLKDIIVNYDEKVGEKVFWHILIESLKGVKIPFTGEPLEGLQVMGLLESRSLDFENVFILSMNEGIMPKGNTHSSFIPYNLRKSFNLPTYEDTDSITAYYFYRLLQRAKKVFLFYNTETNDIYSGEKSRFLLQLESELAKKKIIKLQNTIIQTVLEESKKKVITITKDSTFIERLLKEKHFSATDIKNYINCELKFYLKKISKLDEEESMEEFFSPATFGKIFHSVMQIIFGEYIGKIIDRDTIERLKNKLNSNYDEIISNVFEGIEELKETGPNLQGKNLLLKNVIKKLALKVLNNEFDEVPFLLIDQEMPVEKSLPFESSGKDYKIKLFGRIDRIDEKDGVKRILDYKTGKVNVSRENKDREEMLDEVFINPDFKDVFQAAFYGYLFLSNNNDKTIEIGIYPVKKLDKGINWIDKVDLTKEGLKNFEEKLKQLFAEIFNTTVPIRQTTEQERCNYCPYISICYRE